MSNIQLVKLDPAIEEAFAKDAEFMEALTQDNWARVAELVHKRVGRVLVPIPVSLDELQWGGYFVVDEGTRDVMVRVRSRPRPARTGRSRSPTSRTPALSGAGTRQEWQRS